MWLLFGGLLSFHKGLRQKCSRVNVSCNNLVQRGRTELQPRCCCCCSCHMFVLVPTSSPHESPTLNEHWISCSWKIRFLSKSTFKKRKLNQRWSQVMHWSPDFWLLAEVKAAKTPWHLTVKCQSFQGEITSMFSLPQLVRYRSSACGKLAYLIVDMNLSLQRKLSLVTTDKHPAPGLKASSCP